MRVILPAENKKEIHPLAIFVSGIRLWQKNIGIFSRIYLTVYLPIITISLLGYFIFPPTREKPVVYVNLLMNMAVGLIIMLLSLWGAIALTLAGAKILTDTPIKVGSILAEARQYFFRYLAAQLLYFILFGLIGLGFTIIIGIEDRFFATNIALGIAALLLSAAPFAFAFAYFIIRLSLFGYACVLENKGPISSLRRSHALVKSYITPVVEFYCLLMLLLGIVYLVPWGIVLFLVKNTNQAVIIRNVLAYLIGIILTPISTMAAVLLYYKLKEAAEA